jgi:RNA polymerase sigma-70 factor (ECF subfamily)
MAAGGLTLRIREASMSDLVEQVIPDRGVARIAELYEESQADLFGYALALERDRSAAEELVQESFTRLIAEDQAGRYPNTPRAWLFRVCSNLSASRHRRLNVAERLRHLFVGHDEVEPLDTEILRREREDAMSEALARLPSDARKAVLLAAQGFSGPEIATILGRTHGAIRTLLFRARSELRDQLTGGEM